MIQLMSSTEPVFRVLVSRRHVVPRDSMTLAYRVQCYHSIHSLLYRVVILLEEKLRASATLHLSGTVPIRSIFIGYNLSKITLNQKSSNFPIVWYTAINRQFTLLWRKYVEETGANKPHVDIWYKEYSHYVASITHRDLSLKTICIVICSVHK